MLLLQVLDARCNASLHQKEQCAILCLFATQAVGLGVLSMAPYLLDHQGMSLGLQGC